MYYYKLTASALDIDTLEHDKTRWRLSGVWRNQYCIVGTVYHTQWIFAMGIYWGISYIKSRSFLQNILYSIYSPALSIMEETCLVTEFLFIVEFIWKVKQYTSIAQINYMENFPFKFCLFHKFNHIWRI